LADTEYQQDLDQLYLINESSKTRDECKIELRDTRHFFVL
jgi:hypothetical protein